MPLRQQVFALIVCLLVFFFNIYMIRQRHLKEEYSVLWLGTSIVMFVLVLKYDWLETLTRLIGAGLPTTTLFIGSIIFLMLISVQFSIKISKLSNQLKDLAQDNALLRAELNSLKRMPGHGVESPNSSDRKDVYPHAS